MRVREYYIQFLHVLHTRIHNNYDIVYIHIYAHTNIVATHYFLSIIHIYII